MKKIDLSTIDKKSNPWLYLMLYMSTIEPYEGIKDGEEVKYAIPPKTINDLQVIFDRHWSDYQRWFPGCGVKHFKKKSKELIEQLIGYISDDYGYNNLNLEYDILEWVSVYVDDFLNPVQKELGIKGVLTREELELLYEKMQKKDVDSEKNNFIAALSGELLPDNFKPVKWIDISLTGKTAGSVNKSSLYAFLKAIKGSDQNIPVTREDASKFVGRKKGLNKFVSVVLNKPKTSDLFFEKNLLKFDDLIDSCAVKR